MANDITPVKQAKDLVEKTTENQRDQLQVALKSEGFTPEYIAKLLHDLCYWSTTKADKNGNMHETVDGKLRLEAIKLLADVMDLKSPRKTETKRLNANIEGRLDQLLTK